MCLLGRVFLSEVSVFLFRMSSMKFCLNCGNSTGIGILKRANPAKILCWNQLLLRRELHHALLQAVFHYVFDDFLCNWIPQGMWDCGATNADFVSNILFLPALKIKLDDLHMYRLKGLQGNMIGRGHWPVLLSVALWNSLKLYYFCLFYMAGSAGSVKFQYFFYTHHL